MELNANKYTDTERASKKKRQIQKYHAILLINYTHDSYIFNESMDEKTGSCCYFITHDDVNIVLL